MQSEVITQPPPNAELNAALAKAQAEIDPPPKNRLVDFTDKNGRRVHYKYADLADVISAVRKPFSSNGLAVIHQLDYFGQLYGLKTSIVHSSGQSISCWYPLPDPLKSQIRAQEFGSAITYARRYSLSALAGIASEEDDDGAAAPPVNPPPKKITQQAPQSKPAIQKKPAQNFAPADLIELYKLDALMNERGISNDSVIYFLKEVYNATPKSIPKAAVGVLIQLLEAEGANDATIMAAAVKKENEKKAASILDPGEVVVKIGNQTTGKRMRDIPETKLKEMLTWARGQLKSNPTGPQTAVIAEFQVQATEFLKSMGVEV